MATSLGSSRAAALARDAAASTKQSAREAEKAALQQSGAAEQAAKAAAAAEELAETAAAESAGWTPVLVESSEEEDLRDYVSSSRASKPLKVFPQEFVALTSRCDYRFVVWSDHKFDVNARGVAVALSEWDDRHAVLLHRHPFLSDPDGTGSVEANDILNLLANPVRLRRREIDLVQNRHDLVVIADGLVNHMGSGVRHGLAFINLTRVYQGLHRGMVASQQDGALIGMAVKPGVAGPQHRGLIPVNPQHHHGGPHRLAAQMQGSAMSCASI